MVTAIQPMPSLSPEQGQALREEIEAHGVLVPVVVDQHGRILDGNNRAAIATELGIDYPTVEHRVRDDEDAHDVAVSLNCARRHLSREQVRQVIRGEIARRPDQSDREISRRVGCSPTTVGSVRREVSNLDTDAEWAESITQEITARFEKCCEELADLAIFALSNGIPATSIVASLLRNRRNLESDRATASFAAPMFDPIIDFMLDESASASLSREHRHHTFVPLSNADQTAVLAALEGQFERADA